jgi:hypothetical protein
MSAEPSIGASVTPPAVEATDNIAAETRFTIRSTIDVCILSLSIFYSASLRLVREQRDFTQRRGGAEGRFS